MSTLVTTESPLYTIRQASHLLNVSSSTIRAWLREGRLRRIKLGKAVRLHPSEVDRLLAWGLAPTNTRSKGPRR